MLKQHAIPNFSLCLQAVTAVCHALSCLLHLAVSCHRHRSNVELETSIPKSSWSTWWFNILYKRQTNRNITTSDYIRLHHYIRKTTSYIMDFTRFHYPLPASSNPQTRPRGPESALLTTWDLHELLPVVRLEKRNLSHGRRWQKPCPKKS